MRVCSPHSLTLPWLRVDAQEIFVGSVHKWTNKWTQDRPEGWCPSTTQPASSLSAPPAPRTSSGWSLLGCKAVGIFSGRVCGGTAFMHSSEACTGLWEITPRWIHTLLLVTYCVPTAERKASWKRSGWGSWGGRELAGREMGRKGEGETEVC